MIPNIYIKFRRDWEFESVTNVTLAKIHGLLLGDFNNNNNYYNTLILTNVSFMIKAKRLKVMFNILHE